MRARHFLPFVLGFTLAVAGIQAAAAEDVDTQDTGTLPHSAAVDGSSSKSGGGDLLGAHDSPTSSSSSSSSNDTSSHSGSESNSPPTRRANLGWQSLLPGSIQ
jgi:hypothetical protein